MAIDLHAAIQSALSASQVPGSLYDDLGGRIHAGQLPPDSEMPALRYAIVSGRMDLRLQTDRDYHQVQFDLYGHDVGVLATALGKLRTLLHRQIISDGDTGWRATLLDPGRRFDELDIRRLMTTYQFREIK